MESNSRAPAFEINGKEKTVGFDRFSCTIPVGESFMSAAVSNGFAHPPLLSPQIVLSLTTTLMFKKLLMIPA